MKVEKIEILPKGVRVSILLEHEEINRQTGLNYEYFLRDVFPRLLENNAIDRMLKEKAAEKQLS